MNFRILYANIFHLGVFNMMKTKTIYKQHLLLKQINRKKKEMYTKAKQLGYTHTLVVACSQELDTLLNHYQGMFPYEEVG